MKCVCGSDTPCGGDVEERSLYMGQLQLPLCEVHYKEMESVKIPEGS